LELPISDLNRFEIQNETATCPNALSGEIGSSGVTGTAWKMVPLLNCYREKIEAAGQE
jgi:hypothetical protein